MANFANTLSNVFKKYKLLANRVSAESGVDRSLLSKVMNGTRPLSFYAFKKLLDTINISDTDADLLISTYTEETFGIEKYHKYLKLLKKFSRTEIYKNEESGYNISVSFTFEDGIMNINTIGEIVTIARHLVYIETERDGGRIYSNIPTAIMVDLMRSFPEKQLDFKYIIDSYNHNQESLMTFSDIFDLMSLGYISNYFTSSSNEVSLSIIYPFYIISTDYILLFDRYSGKGILCNNQAIIEQYTEIFLEKFAETTPYINKYNDILMLKEKNTSIYKNGVEKITWLHEFGCYATMFLTLDMWDQIARPDVPNRDYLRDTTYQYYKWIFTSQISNTCNISGRNSLKEFVDHGIIKSMPREFAFPLSKENRVKVLESVYDLYASDDSLNFYFFDDAKLNFCHNFGIELYDNVSRPSSMSFCYSVEDCALHYCGNFSMQIDDSKTIHEFAEFINCFITSKHCYSKRKSLEFLKEEILRCKMLPEN